MKYNYGLEKAKFDKEWKTLEEEYISAGMTPQQILSLKAFDKSVINSNRAYYRRNIRLESINELSAEEDYLLSPLDELKNTHDNNEETLQNDKSICDIYDYGFELNEYDDILVRKLIECVRVVDKERVEVVFKGEDSISTAYMIK